jgi:hypothetical protein
MDEDVPEKEEKDPRRKRAERGAQTRANGSNAGERQPEIDREASDRTQ